MNPVATKYGAAPLAAVNLVPKDIQERRKLRAVQFMAVVAVLAAVGAVILGFLAGIGAEAAAKAGLNDALARQDTALQARDAKASVYNAYVSREQDEYALAQAGYGEIDFSQFATAVANTAADGKTNFQDLHFSGPSALGFGGGNQDSLFGSSVGSFEFTAYSLSAQEASAFLLRLDAVPGVANVRATTESYTTDGKVYWVVEGTGLITESVLTGRLIPSESVTGVDALAMVKSQSTDTPGAVPAPSPDASPSPSPSPTATPESEG